MKAIYEYVFTPDFETLSARYRKLKNQLRSPARATLALCEWCEDMARLQYTYNARPWWQDDTQEESETRQKIIRDRQNETAIMIETFHTLATVFANQLNEKIGERFDPDAYNT